MDSCIQNQLNEMQRNVHLNSVANDKTKKEKIQNEPTSLKLHSYVVWNPIQIVFLEIRFSLTGQIGFSMAFSLFHAM